MKRTLLKVQLIEFDVETCVKKFLVRSRNRLTELRSALLM